MSSKSRKFPGVRRAQRPRHWARWYREGVLEPEARASVRLRRTLWSLPNK
jgi:hypothetical protein